MLKEYINANKGKTIAFIGAGVAHKDIIKIFAQNGAVTRLCDAKTAGELGGAADEMSALGVKLFLGNNYLNGLCGADIIFRTPGFMSTHPALLDALKSNCVITSEIEVFFKLCPAKIIGITGSDGKTTTSSLIAAMLRAAGKTVHLGGNIGKALLPIIDSVALQDIVVCELSSFQLMSMKQSPDIAVITNVTPNHLDHHSDMDEYIDAKRNIIRYQSRNDIAVLGFDNDISREFSKDINGNIRYFSISTPQNNGAYLNHKGVLTLSVDGREQSVTDKDEILIPGRHNIQNMLAAMASVADYVPYEIMAKTAKTFPGVAHRIEFVRCINGVKYYNDSIATSPTRVIAGLCSFSVPLIVIAGGYDKNIPFKPLAPYLIKHAKCLIVMGATGSKIVSAVKEDPDFNPETFSIFECNDMNDAVKTAYEYAKSGDIVTLSPASASFDCYENFEKRGEHFIHIVNKLK